MNEHTCNISGHKHLIRPFGNIYTVYIYIHVYILVIIDLIAHTGAAQPDLAASYTHAHLFVSVVLISTYPPWALTVPLPPPPDTSHISSTDTWLIRRLGGWELPLLSSSLSARHVPHCLAAKPGSKPTSSVLLSHSHPL